MFDFQTFRLILRDPDETRPGEAFWTTAINNKMFDKVSKLIEALEDLDDVQNVYSNFDIDDKLLDSALTI